jgi:hypothetical protein
MRPFHVLALACAAGSPAIGQSAGAPARNITDFQVLGGAGFQQLLIRTATMCPDVPVKRLTPAGLLDIEDSYGANLAGKTKSRFAAAAAEAGRACTDRNGASCPAVETLSSLNRKGMLTSFARHLCAPGIVG